MIVGRLVDDGTAEITVSREGDEIILDVGNGCEDGQFRFPAEAAEYFVRQLGIMILTAGREDETRRPSIVVPDSARGDRRRQN